MLCGIVLLWLIVVGDTAKEAVKILEETGDGWINSVKQPHNGILSIYERPSA